MALMARCLRACRGPALAAGRHAPVSARPRPLASGGAVRHLPRPWRSTASATAAATAAGPPDLSAAPPPAGERQLLLLDANALVYRMHFSMGAKLLTSPSGEDVTVLYGFIKIILQLLGLRPPATHMAVVFDARGKNFRHEMYPEYKAQRPPMPEEISAARPRIGELLASLALPVLQVPGVEADDVIASLAVRAVREGFCVSIASQDKDFYQLLQPNLWMLKPAKPHEWRKAVTGNLVQYTEHHFERDFGIKPAQHRDVQALEGDSTDNIPGVKGIGCKGALKLVQQYGDLDAIIENAAQIEPKRYRSALLSPDGVATARLCRQLVTLLTDSRIPTLQHMDLDAELALKPHSPQQQAATRALLADLGFKEHAATLEALWAQQAGG